MTRKTKGKDDKDKREIIKEIKQSSTLNLRLSVNESEMFDFPITTSEDTPPTVEKIQTE